MGSLCVELEIAYMALVDRVPQLLQVLDQHSNPGVIMSASQSGKHFLQKCRGNNKSSPPKHDEKSFFWLMLYGVSIAL